MSLVAFATTSGLKIVHNAQRRKNGSSDAIKKEVHYEHSDVDRSWCWCGHHSLWLDWMLPLHMQA